MFWFILIALIAVCAIGIGNTFKALFAIGTLALVASALYVAGYMLIVMAVNA